MACPTKSIRAAPAWKSSGRPSRGEPAWPRATTHARPPPTPGRSAADNIDAPHSALLPPVSDSHHSPFEEFRLLPGLIRQTARLVALGHENRVLRLRQLVRVVERVVQPAAFVPAERRADDQVGDLEQVAKLDQV